MHDALLVDELDPINDLEHVLNNLALGQLKILVNDSLKQLAARDPAANRRAVSHHQSAKGVPGILQWPVKINKGQKVEEAMQDATGETHFISIFH